LPHTSSVGGPGFGFDGDPVAEVLLPVGIAAETGHTYPMGGAIGGLALAHWLTRAFVAIAPAGLPRLDGRGRRPRGGLRARARWRKTADDDLATCYLLGGGYHSVNTLVVRSARDAAALLPAVRSTLRDYDPNIVVTSTATMDSLLRRSIVEEHFRATLSAIFGGAALVLAAVGLYGLAARRVADRRRQIAIRVALGARPKDVLGLVLRDALCTVGLGLAAGLPAALVASQAARTLLFGVTPTAPRLFVVAATVLALAALVATLLPARRAARGRDRPDDRAERVTRQPPESPRGSRASAV